MNRRGEWAALLLGAAFSVWATSPWRIHDRWVLHFVLASSLVMFSLMALAIYDCVVRTRRLTRIVRSGLQLDLFDRRSFTPLARWGQIVSLTFVGGTCLSLLFQSYESLATAEAHRRRSGRARRVLRADRRARRLRRQVLAASTWPFNPKIVKELVASLAAPILIYRLRIALGLSRST